MCICECLLELGMLVAEQDCVAMLHLPGCLDCPACAGPIPSPSMVLGVVGVGVDWGKEWWWWGVYTKSHPESAG